MPVGIRVGGLKGSSLLGIYAISKAADMSGNWITGQTIVIDGGAGYLLHTASAAGLLTQVGGAPYSVTKHAAVAFVEWLSITHGDAGIKISCLCPQGVRTQMLLGPDGERESFLRAGAVEPEDVAEAVVAGLAAERFLILPHPEVAEYFRRKAQDYDRWLRGMRRLNAQARG